MESSRRLGQGSTGSKAKRGQADLWRQMGGRGAIIAYVSLREQRGIPAMWCNNANSSIVDTHFSFETMNS
jgi:hypothetical protein